MKKMIIAILVVIVSIIIISSYKLFLSNSKNKNNSFSKNNKSSYSKEETSEYNFNISSDKLTIKSSCSEIKIKKSDTKDIKITMNKKISGEKEKDLEEMLKNINCEFKDGILSINPSFKNKGKVSSTSIETIINIPKNINILDIESKIGKVTLKDDYDSLNINISTGDIDYTGELKQCEINSKLGETKLNLKSLENDYKYKIRGDMGNVKITIPEGNKINLIKNDSTNIKLNNNLEIDDNGAIFDIEKKMSNVTIGH